MKKNNNSKPNKPMEGNKDAKLRQQSGQKMQISLKIKIMILTKYRYSNIRCV